jgi:hypothetical protein
MVQGQTQKPYRAPGLTVHGDVEKLTLLFGQGPADYVQGPVSVPGSSQCPHTVPAPGGGGLICQQ